MINEILEFLKKLVTTSREDLFRKMDEASCPIEIMAYFLRTGTLPWWDNHVKGASPEKTLLGLMKASPSATRVMLTERAPIPGVYPATGLSVFSTDDGRADQTFGSGGL